MPTTLRLLFRLLALAVIGAAAVYLLANFVEPTPQPLSIVVPTDRFE
ncbi:MAG: hypothetical protein AAGH60_10905 [Pseudomonadota bacterium]